MPTIENFKDYDKGLAARDKLEEAIRESIIEAFEDWPYTDGVISLLGEGLQTMSYSVADWLKP